MHAENIGPYVPECSNVRTNVLASTCNSIPEYIYSANIATSPMEIMQFRR
jgi:hypothetical protein